MSERDDLINTLRRHRGFLLATAEGLTQEEAHAASTVSALTIASLLKHVADTEEQWMAFAVQGPEAFGAAGGGTTDDDRFTIAEAEPLGVLEDRIAEVAAQTEDILRTVDLDSEHALPEAHWFEPGAAWSVRRIALHLVAEIAQHTGHADIIREALDDQRTMG